MPVLPSSQGDDIDVSSSSDGSDVDMESMFGSFGSAE